MRQFLCNVLVRASSKIVPFFAQLPPINTTLAATTRNLTKPAFHWGPMSAPSRQRGIRAPGSHWRRLGKAVIGAALLRASAIAAQIGRPSIDAELMLRMLIVGYCYGLHSERRQCEEVEHHLAYRWFCRPSFCPRDLGLMLAHKHLLKELESKGMMSHPETQRMLDEALGR
jgi:hypothetical protein